MEDGDTILFPVVEQVLMILKTMKKRNYFKNLAKRLKMKSKLYLDQHLLKVNVVSIVFLLIFGILLVSSATAVESQKFIQRSIRLKIIY